MLNRDLFVSYLHSVNKFEYDSQQYYKFMVRELLKRMIKEGLIKWKEIKK